MTPQELKASILQLAMQGKITERMYGDGNARDLLKHLHVDKKVIPSEPPFDIPENWLWIPIGNLGASIDTDSFSDGPFGSNLKTDHQIAEPEVRIIQLSNIGEDGWKDKNTKYTSFKHLETVIPRCEVRPGDFVIAKMMPAGRTIQVPQLGTRITLGSDAMKFVPNPILNKQYLLYAMRSQAFLQQVYAEAHGITRVRTTLNSVKSYVLPIPPLAEQKRIVAKIEELLPYIDRYEQAWSKLEDFNKRFPVDMQKSILQMAIQGKLVEQRPEEGTGEELYQQIQAEKKRLIKVGEIKKEKPLPEITEDELPFDIPDSWKWVRLSQLFSVLNGDRGKNYPAKSTLSHEGIPFISALNLDGKSVIEDDNLLCLSEQQYEKLGNGKLIRDDIVVCIRGSLGKHGRYPFDKGAIASSLVILRAFTNDDVLAEFLMMYLDTPLFFSEIRRYDNGTAQPNLAAKSLEHFLVPLPPLAEQKRIVAKLEEILPLCERLK